MEKKKLNSRLPTLNISEKTRSELERIAAERETTLSALMREAILDLINKYSNK